MEHIASYSKEDLVYVDESGIDHYVHRSHGWAPRGEPVYGEISGKRYARESFIAAKCGPTLLALLCFTGTCDTVLFNLWIEEFLVPALRAGQVVILDNAPFHRSEKTQQLIANASCKLFFLPPYSPDLNPIEIFWANLKAKIRSTMTHFSPLFHAIDHAFSL